MTTAAFIAYGLLGWAIGLALIVYCMSRAPRHPYRNDWPSSEVDETQD